VSRDSDGSGASGVPEPPFGTGRRIRNRAIWAVAWFTAAVPPAFVGLGIATGTDDPSNLAIPLAVLFWIAGFLCALWAAVPTLRYWDGLPNTTRWLGALPLLYVSLFLSVAVVVPLL
jgi:hypothetical protein